MVAPGHDHGFVGSFQPNRALVRRHDRGHDPARIEQFGSDIRFNEHIEGDGPTVFAHACKMGLEGIVSKRKDSPYRSGRSPDWLKMKNPACAAVTREAEEDWSK